MILAHLPSEITSCETGQRRTECKEAHNFSHGWGRVGVGGAIAAVLLVIRYRTNCFERPGSTRDVLLHSDKPSQAGISMVWSIMAWTHGRSPCIRPDATRRQLSSFALKRMPNSTAHEAKDTNDLRAKVAVNYENEIAFFFPVKLWLWVVAPRLWPIFWSTPSIPCTVKYYSYLALTP